MNILKTYPGFDYTWYITTAWKIDVVTKSKDGSAGIKKKGYVVKTITSCSLPKKDTGDAKKKFPGCQVTLIKFECINRDGNPRELYLQPALLDFDNQRCSEWIARLWGRQGAALISTPRKLSKFFFLFLKLKSFFSPL